MADLIALPQLEVEIKFYLGQTAQNIIEVGKRLIQAKSLVQHGHWQNWLEQNFQLSYQSAARFMECADKFSNLSTLRDLKPSQMFQLLSLPSEEETEKFIAQKAAEGKAIAELTIKQLREEIASYKATIETQEKNYQQSLFDLAERDKAVINEQEENFQQLLAEKQKELDDRPTVVPADYQETKDALFDTKCALRELERDNKRRTQELQSKLDDAAKQITKLKKANERAERKSYTPPNQLHDDDCKLFHADIRDGLPQIADNSVDFIITDPPYPKEFLPLYADLSKVAARVLKVGGSLVCMTGQSYLPDVIQLLASNMTYHWCLCYLTPGQKTQLWQRHLHTAWKPLLWFVKGNYSGDWLGDDVFTSPAKDKTFHNWGQSVGGMKDIVERFTNPNDIILDPFLGGGTTAIVTITSGRKFIGVDIDQSCIDTTNSRIKEVFANG